MHAGKWWSLVCIGDCKAALVQGCDALGACSQAARLMWVSREGSCRKWFIFLHEMGRVLDRCKDNNRCVCEVSVPALVRLSVDVIWLRFDFFVLRAHFIYIRSMLMQSTQPFPSVQFSGIACIRIVLLASPPSVPGILFICKTGSVCWLYSNCSFPFAPGPQPLANVCLHDVCHFGIGFLYLAWSL